jgi:hypothetical protein
MSGKRFLIQSVEFDNFEVLRSAIPDNDVEIVQLSSHPVKGSLLRFDSRIRSAQ